MAKSQIAIVSPLCKTMQRAKITYLPTALPQPRTTAVKYGEQLETELSHMLCMCVNVF